MSSPSSLERQRTVQGSNAHSEIPRMDFEIPELVFLLEVSLFVSSNVYRYGESGANKN